MFKKIILLIILFNLTYQCGFSPLYHENNNFNFSIVSVNFEGDRELNNLFKGQLYLYQNDRFEKKYELKIKTFYVKKGILKDKKGKITNYKLVANSIIQISLDGKKIKELKITEDKTIDNINDKFEERKNEKIAKQSFAKSMSNKLLTELSLLYDN